MKLKHFTVLLAASTMFTVPANATYLQYDLTGDYFATWWIQLDGPDADVPDAADDGVGIGFYDVQGSFPGYFSPSGFSTPGSTPGYVADFNLYNSAFGGGFTLDDAYGPDAGTFLNVTGAQLYSGLETGTPTLLTGTFDFVDADNSNYSFRLVVTQVETLPVPEPATWAMMIAGFGAVGGALRARRNREQAVRVSFG